MRSRISLLAMSTVLWCADSFSAPNCENPEPQIFHVNRIQDWVIQGDFDLINDHTIESHEKERASSDGTLGLTNSSKTFSVKISARGAFRFEECPLRPFNLQLLNKQNKGQFPFLRHFSKLKLTTVCYDDQTYRENEIRKLLKEYTIYKMINHLNGPHLQVQLLNVKLVASNGKKYFEGPAFLRETEKALSSRCNLDERRPTVLRWDNISRTMVRWVLFENQTLAPYLYKKDKVAELRAEFVNRFINNPDFDIESDHNIIPLVPKNNSELIEFPIPYDFDLSQAAGATYFGYTKTAVQVAEEVKQWLFEEQQIAPELSRQMSDEFLASITGMKEEIKSSPIDQKGKADLGQWVNAFEAVFSK